MKQKMVSWETPPKEGEKFMVRTDRNRMILSESVAHFQENMEDLLRGEELIGWLPISVDNVKPPFLNIPPKPEEIISQ